VLGGQFLGSHAFEISMIGTGVAFGLYSTIRAYPAHRRKLPLQLVALGTAMIVVGLFFAPEVIEPVLIPVGAVLLGAAQVLNIRYVRQCEDCAH
ncbi:MAG: MerC family mercury resistance protein, partial [Bacteroidota bacterium]